MEEAKHVVTCPICDGNVPYTVLFKERIPPGRPQFSEFSARKTPMRMHFRIVRCNNCGLVYSSPVYLHARFEQFYKESAFFNEHQLNNMGTDYLQHLKNNLQLIGNKGRLLDIGAANGFFLKLAKQLGFKEVYGIEPSMDALQQADPDFRPHIINDMFSKHLFPPDHFDVVCFFQVFDHVVNQNEFLQHVQHVLKPGGILLAINHNVRSFMTRLLGKRSPMYDIEHMHLFDKTTMRLILEKNSFEVLSIRSIPNRYAFEYVAKIFPFPLWLKSRLTRILRAACLAEVGIWFYAGNMCAIARKKPATVSFPPADMPSPSGSRAI